jgi:hypothetical protein
MLDQNLIIGLIVLAILVLAVYAYAPKFRAMLSGLGLEGFEAPKMGVPNGMLSKNKMAGMGGTAGGSKNAQNTAAALKKQNPNVAGPAPAPVATANGNAKKAVGEEEFADYSSIGNDLGAVPMSGGKGKGCYPRNQLTPSELLPTDQNSTWAAANPVGAGDIQGKNFLSAGALVGVNTVGQSLRNGNLQLRSEPPNPQTQVGPWLQSTIEPDLQRRPLE